MITISLPAIVLLTILSLLLATAFILGWNLAVYRWRAEQKNWGVKYAILANKFERLAGRLDSDPQRAAIDLGKESVIQALNRFLREIEPET